MIRSIGWMRLVDRGRRPPSYARLGRIGLKEDNGEQLTARQSLWWGTVPENQRADLIASARQLRADRRRIRREARASAAARQFYLDIGALPAADQFLPTEGVRSAPVAPAARCCPAGRWAPLGL